MRSATVLEAGFATWHQCTSSNKRRNALTTSSFPTDCSLDSGAIRSTCKLAIAMLAHSETVVSRSSAGLKHANLGWGRDNSQDQRSRQRTLSSLLLLQRRSPNSRRLSHQCRRCAGTIVHDRRTEAFHQVIVIACGLPFKNQTVPISRS